MEKKYNFSKIFTTTITIVILLIGLLFLIPILPIKNNYKILSIRSGSMEPTIKIGSLIFIRPANNYQVEDIITFKNGEGKNSEITTTHRIVAVSQQDNETIFITKGDANKTFDSQPVTLKQIVGKCFFKVSYLGYLFSFIQTLPGLILLIIIPAVIIIYEEIKNIKKEIIDWRQNKSPKKKGQNAKKKLS